MGLENYRKTSPILAVLALQFINIIYNTLKYMKRHTKYLKLENKKAKLYGRKQLIKEAHKQRTITLDTANEWQRLSIGVIAY